MFNWLLCLKSDMFLSNVKYNFPKRSTSDLEFENINILTQNSIFACNWLDWWINALSPFSLGLICSCVDSNNQFIDFLLESMYGFLSNMWKLLFPTWNCSKSKLSEFAIERLQFSNGDILQINREKNIRLFEKD